MVTDAQTSRGETTPKVALPPADTDLWGGNAVLYGAGSLVVCEAQEWAAPRAAVSGMRLKVYGARVEATATGPGEAVHVVFYPVVRDPDAPVHSCRACEAQDRDYGLLAGLW